LDSNQRISFLQNNAYSESGDGPVLLLLHGFCETHAIFDGLVSALAARCRVIMPDLPGHGGTAWDKGIRSLDDVACWLRDFLDAMEVERCVLVGHSLGGYIAAAFADLFPERLLGFGMLHSTALDDPAERREGRTKSIAFVERNGKEPFLKAFVESLFHSPEPQWLETMTKISAGTDEAAIVVFLRIMRDRPDRSGVIGRLKVPVMYIIGAHDALVSPERSRQELQQLPLALLHRLASASHMGMYEAPEKVVGAILSLMEVSGGI
jgi:3-oxoadipate enol-lactonase